jgi:hypothetical protein
MVIIMPNEEYEVMMQAEFVEYALNGTMSPEQLVSGMQETCDYAGKEIVGMKRKHDGNDTISLTLTVKDKSGLEKRVSLPTNISKKSAIQKRITVLEDALKNAI